MINKKIISITGTPGTGKTKVASLLAKKLNANLIEINKLVKNRQISYALDKKRNTKIIDVKKMRTAVRKKILRNHVNIIDGHLSHFIKSDFVVLLRTDPVVLKKRLKSRKWKYAKIKENVQAEIIDEILIEVLEKYPKSRIIEINATKREPENTAKLIIRVLNNHSLQKVYSPGRIKWLKKYYRMLE